VVQQINIGLSLGWGFMWVYPIKSSGCWRMCPPGVWTWTVQL